MAEVLRYREEGIDRRRGEHDAERPSRISRAPDRVDPEDLEGTRRGRDERADDAEERGLAGAFLSEDGEDVTRLDRKAQPPERFVPLVGMPQPAYLECDHVQWMRWSKTSRAQSSGR